VPLSARLSDATSAWTTLSRLRWLAAAGQLIVLALVMWADFKLPNAAIFGVAMVTASSNVILGRWVRLAWRVQVAVVLDIVLLTALLGLAGGPHNPFTALYLVHTALSAALLGPRWTWGVALLSTFGYAALFPWHYPVHEIMQHHDPTAHLRGMWVAFAITSVAIAFFVARLAAVARDQAEALIAAAARADRLASLTTLAAGAAHELGSPLTTIAIAAKELENGARQAGRETDAEDAKLIGEETARCREILQEIAGRAGTGVGEAPERVDGEWLEAELRRALGEALSARVDVAHGRAFWAILPPRTFGRAVVTLVRNALEASPDPQRVSVQLRRGDEAVEVEVLDSGVGLSAAVAARVGEPFFTTRPPGQGLGLGVFLARAFVEQTGGEMTLTSAPGKGTRVLMRWPLPT
jgi:two-component system sensor histidine kinase RegB